MKESDIPFFFDTSIHLRRRDWSSEGSLILNRLYQREITNRMRTETKPNDSSPISLMSSASSTRNLSFCMEINSREDVSQTELGRMLSVSDAAGRNLV